MASSLGGAILNDAEIGAPNSSAFAASSVSASDQPYSPGTPGASRRSTWKSDRKTGICGRIGTQPASGLTPRSFCRAIIAWLMPWRSLPYCLRSSAISGCSSCIARCDLICLTNSGNRMIRMVTTRLMIASAQARPLSPLSTGGSPRTAFHNECHCAITQEMAVYSQSSNGGLLVSPTEVRRGGWVGTAVVNGRDREHCCARRVAAVCGSGMRVGIGDQVDTAGGPGSALDQAPQRQPGPARGAVPQHGLGRIGAAGRVEAEPRRQGGDDRPRIEAYG